MTELTKPGPCPLMIDGIPMRSSINWCLGLFAHQDSSTSQAKQMQMQSPESLHFVKQGAKQGSELLVHQSVLASQN